MKSLEKNIKTVKEEKVLLNVESKPKSLRPMRSMMATRSLKPQTTVTSFVTKTQETKG